MDSPNMPELSRPVVTWAECARRYRAKMSPAEKEAYLGKQRALMQRRRANKTADDRINASIWPSTYRNKMSDDKRKTTLAKQRLRMQQLRDKRRMRPFLELIQSSVFKDVFLSSVV